MTWDAWAARRPEPHVVHLDSGAAGRASTATIEAVASHVRREAELGAYVAEEEAAPVVEAARQQLADLLGVDLEGVGLTGSARAGLRMLLETWQLAQGKVAVAPSEWGPNLQLFVDRGLVPQVLPVDETGRIDLAACAAELRKDRPALVHLVASSAHRGLRQPVTEMTGICRELGLPIWVDAAQAVGQVTDLAADAVYGTSRKWLTGPRGVGFLAVDRASWERLNVPMRPDVPPDLRPVELLTVGEANIAGRVGLGVALDEYVADGPEPIAARLDEVGAQTRQMLAGVRDWQVVPGQDGPISAIRPTEGQDVLGVRERLLREHRILTTASLPWRAPLEEMEGWLRVSPHVDATEAQLERLATVLSDA